jgi:hypothetical protein
MIRERKRRNVRRCVERPRDPISQIDRFPGEFTKSRAVDLGESTCRKHDSRKTRRKQLATGASWREITSEISESSQRN